jgi:hypothetical protein
MNHQASKNVSNAVKHADGIYVLPNEEQTRASDFTGGIQYVDQLTNFLTPGEEGSK